MDLLHIACECVFLCINNQVNVYTWSGLVNLFKEYWDKEQTNQPIIYLGFVNVPKVLHTISACTKVYNVVHKKRDNLRMNFIGDFEDTLQ